MKHVGRLEEVGIAIEGVRNVAEAAPQKWMKRVAAGIVSKVEKVMDDNTRGVLEDSEGSRATKISFEGDIEGILHIDGAGYIALSVYGESTPTNLGNGCYSHLFELEQSIEHPTLSIFRKDEEATQKVYGGGVVGKWVITAKPEDYVRFVASMACSNEDDDSSTPSYSTEFDFIGRDCSVKIADTEGGLAGATALEVKEVVMTWDPGLIQDFVLGSKNSKNYNGKMSIEVELTKNFEDDTFEDLYKADTYKYMEVAIVGDVALATGIYPTLKLRLNRAAVIEWSKDSPADGLVTEKIKIKAYFNASDAEQSTLTMINKTAAYVAAS